MLYSGAQRGTCTVLVHDVSLYTRCTIVHVVERLLTSCHYWGIIVASTITPVLLAPFSLRVSGIQGLYNTLS